MKFKKTKTVVLFLSIALGVNFIKKGYPATQIYLKKFRRKKELKSLKMICLVWLDNVFKNETVEHLRLVRNSLIKK